VTDVAGRAVRIHAAEHAVVADLLAAAVVADLSTGAVAITATGQDLTLVGDTAVSLARRTGRALDIGATHREVTTDVFAATISTDFAAVTIFANAAHVRAFAHVFATAVGADPAGATLSVCRAAVRPRTSRNAAAGLVAELATGT
jgi:hypothetical protein